MTRAQLAGQNLAVGGVHQQKCLHQDTSYCTQPMLHCRSVKLRDCGIVGCRGAASLSGAAGHPSVCRAPGPCSGAFPGISRWLLEVFLSLRLQIHFEVPDRSECVWDWAGCWAQRRGCRSWCHFTCPCACDSATSQKACASCLAWTLLAAGCAFTTCLVSLS